MCNIYELKTGSIMTRCGSFINSFIQVLITFGGWQRQGDVLVTSNGSPSRTVGLYNPSAKEWINIGELPVKLAYAEAIKIDSEVSYFFPKVFVLNGRLRFTSLEDTFRTLWKGKLLPGPRGKFSNSNQS